MFVNVVNSVECRQRVAPRAVVRERSGVPSSSGAVLVNRRRYRQLDHQQCPRQSNRRRARQVNINCQLRRCIVPQPDMVFQAHRCHVGVIDTNIVIQRDMYGYATFKIIGIDAEHDYY